MTDLHYPQPDIIREKGDDARGRIIPGSSTHITLVRLRSGHGDQIRLGSRSIPNFKTAVVKNKTALMLRANVAPHQSVTFKFHIRIFLVPKPLTTTSGQGRMHGEHR